MAHAPQAGHLWPRVIMLFYAPIVTEIVVERSVFRANYCRVYSRKLAGLIAIKLLRTFNNHFSRKKMIGKNRL